MRFLSRKLLSFVASGLLIGIYPALAVAQTPDIYSPVQDILIQQDSENEPFSQWGLPTPPGAEGYEVNQVQEEEDLNPQGENEWYPTKHPKKRLVVGQMRSDREELPHGVDKGEADKAEIREAQLADPNARTVSARRGCGVYWPLNFQVCGAIKTKYDSIGGPTSFLGFPKSNELTNPDRVGKRSEFINGYIYWHPSTGAHTVSLPVSVVWARHGWEKGFLGYPITSDIPQGNAWYKQDFQGGHVYTHNELLPTQASIQGAIYDKWQSMGAQNSKLGYPISDELTTPDGIGRYNVFEGGMIYWTPQTGAHEVLGLPLQLWAFGGFEGSKWGYPTGSPVNSPDAPVAVRQSFAKADMDIRREFEEAGEVNVGGKPVNKLLMEMLQLNPNSSIFNRNEMQSNIRASKCALKDSTRSEFGGVTIPSNYDYWGCLPNWPIRDGIRRHDYCSHSPDKMVSVGRTAEFSGACARHDMCMDKADDNGNGYGGCNSDLYANMGGVCRSVYGIGALVNGCQKMREVYWTVVTAWNYDNL
ncbi:hypothetical protein F4V58_12345 [Corynebacterium phocae]|nr:hypothetical protein F4V58_12345 [Corynebacterium phocae]